MGKCGEWCGWFWAIIVLILLLGAIGYMIEPKHNISSSKPTDWSSDPDLDPNSTSSNPSPPYIQALITTLRFFDVQKSGKLVKNTITWRGDSGLDDGSEANIDLSKGMYDAGDHIKFGFPMAFTATMLSWSILEYGGFLDPKKHLEPAKDSLRWITDYLIMAHDSHDVLYVQVGDPETDHKCWDKPETMSQERPLKKVDLETPGSDVAAETSAALASASLVFQRHDVDYSKNLLRHAKELFEFSDAHKGLYSVSIPEVQKYYNSSGYGDELLWAAAWLFHATGNASYLNYVVDNGDDFADFGNPHFFSWNDKLPGVQVLLSRLLFFDSKNVSEKNVLTKYKQTAEAVMCILLPTAPTSSSSRTQSGLLWVSQWNSLQEAMASAFLISLYSDYMSSSPTDQNLLCDDKYFASSDLKTFAKSQADYVLGKNPMNMSYLVGYGDKYPNYVHHRGASIPADATTGCTDGFVWLTSEAPNPNVAVGAVVGGPFLNDTYLDDRNNTMQSEPTTYNAALLVALLSSLVTSTSTLLTSFI